MGHRRCECASMGLTEGEILLLCVHVISSFLSCVSFLSVSSFQSADEEGGGAAAGGGSSHAPSAPSASLTAAEGLEFSMPHQGGVDQAQIDAEGIGEVKEGVDDLMAQLAALGGGK